MAERIRVEQKELKTPDMGVFEETAELKRVMMWGLPGAETVLGQLLPKKRSCFQKSFNVSEARDEMEGAMDLLRKKGVEIFVVKDEWAKMIQEKGIKADYGIDELKSELKDKGEYLYLKYKKERDEEYQKEKKEALEKGERPEEPAGLEVLELLDSILDADVKKYGENAAVVMNQKLSIDGYCCKDGENLPLSNIFYARDQSNLMGSTWIWSSMKHEIRKAEVPIYKEVVRYSGILKDQGITEVNVEETKEGVGLFEGGDGIVNNGIAYIGLGGRSDLEGIKQAAKPILESGLRLVICRDRNRARLGEDEMDAMHLDTFWMPTDLNEVVGCPDEIKNRKAFEVYLDEKSQIKFKSLGSFSDHLHQREIDMVPLTIDEQRKYAPNFLNLGGGIIILSLANGNNLTEELTSRGKVVYNADFQEVTKGFGGLHCATASLLRV
ncbi:MAG TPA: arginine deiminase family protein [Patescibacteria group bacterium]|nr:arginine deiminase family protein [Patescibacteria group bacterium]